MKLTSNISLITALSHFEAEEVIDNALLTKKAGQGKYMAYGQTDTLAVIL
ncbi:MAG: hypothetical protein R2911_34700 [Caldilineaceae bacterium]